MTNHIKDLRSRVGRLEYERAIRRSQLPAMARLLALTLATWADIDSGVIPARFQPSTRTLLEATGMGKPTFLKALGWLEEEGWVSCARPTAHDARTRHVRNSYRLSVPVDRDDRNDRDSAESPVDLELGQQVTQGWVSSRPRAGSAGDPKSPLKSQESHESLSGGGPHLQSVPMPTPQAPERDEQQPSPTNTTPPRSQAHRRVRALKLVRPEHEDALIEWITREFHVRSSGWWRAAEDADLIAHAKAWQQQEAERMQPARRMREWCGECALDVPGLGAMVVQAQTNPNFRRLPSGELCPRCHPTVAGLHVVVA